MKVQALTFSTFHGKRPDVGSTNIRVNQLMKYWPEYTKYRYGDFPDVLIFQKVYVGEDYKFPIHFENKKILDICDPDHLEGHAIVETVQAMDAVTCPTEPIAKFIRQFTNKPVVVIPDRFDLEVIPEPKTHTGDAKTVVWFGYSHNSGCLKAALPLLDDLDLDLIIISNDNPNIGRWRQKENKIKFVKYADETVYQELQKADFCLLPDNFRPQDEFKSNNKTVKAILAGLPVAKTADEVRLFINPEERQKYLHKEYTKTRDAYDVRLSVKEMEDLIKTL